MSQRRRHAGRPLAIAVALVAFANLAVTCGPAPPHSDTCALSAGTADAGLRDGTVTSLEVGTVDGSGRFAPFVADTVVPLQLGGQGSTMIVAHLRLRGSGIPSCLPQTTQLEYLDGTPIITESAPVPLELGGDGAWTSGALLLVYDREPGAKVRVHTVVDGVETSVALWLDAVGVDAAGEPVDAAVDAP